MKRKVGSTGIIEHFSFIVMAIVSIVAIVTALSGCDLSAGGQGDEADVPGEQQLAPARAELDRLDAPVQIEHPDVELQDDTGFAGWCADVQYPRRTRPTGAIAPLTKNEQGHPFNASAEEVGISRDGTLAVFTVLPTEEFGVNGLPDDTNHSRDVYATQLDNEAFGLELVSVNNDGQVGDGDSFEPNVGPKGRFVAFTSYARNLTDHDSDGYSAIYLRSRDQGRTHFISASNQNHVPNGDSYNPVVSADGRYVAFLSAASNLVADDTNDRVDVFVRDLQDGVTKRISLDTNGQQVNDDAGPLAGISADGRYVLFTHPSRLADNEAESGNQDAEESKDVYRVDWIARRNILVTRPRADEKVVGAAAVSLSPDGRRVLLHVEDGNALLDRTEGERGPATILAHVSDAGVDYELVKNRENPATGMSDSGHVVAFSSKMIGLVGSVDVVADGVATANAYAHDRDTNETRLLTAAENGVPAVLHDYAEPGVRERDWVGVAVSGGGERFVMSSIQYGIVPNASQHCANHRPRLVYLVDCSF